MFSGIFKKFFLLKIPVLKGLNSANDGIFFSLPIILASDGLLSNIFKL